MNKVIMKNEECKQLEEESACLENKLNFELLMSNIAGGVEICEMDECFTITYVSKGFIDITGYSAEEIKRLFNNKHMSMLVLEDLARVNEEIREQLKNGNSFAIEYRIKKKDGSIVWILDNAMLIQLESGKIIVQCILIDITKQKLTEEALRVSEKRYEIALGFSDITIFDYNINTKIITGSSYDHKSYGMPKTVENGVEGMINLGIIHKKSQGAFRELYKKIDDGAPSAQTTIIAVDVDKNERTLFLQMFNIFNDDGKPVTAVGMHKDITETLLLHREKEYGSALILEKKLVYEAILTNDTIVYYDVQWMETIGIYHVGTLSEMIEIIAENTVFVEDREIFLLKSSKKFIISEFEKGTKLITFEYRKKIDKKRYEWVEKTINIIKDEFTDEIYIRCYLKNINEKKGKEIKLAAEQKRYEMMISKCVNVYEVNISQNKLIIGTENWSEFFGINQSENYDYMVHEFIQKAIYTEDAGNFLSLYLRENVLEAFRRGETKISLEYRRYNGNGKYIWVRYTMNVFENPKTGEIRAFSYVDNINAEKEKQLELIYKSQHDLLTGLYNKVTVEEKINGFLCTDDAKLSNHAFFMIDLDHFKDINDSFGHAFGDVALSQVSEKIRILFRGDDIIGRVGGDEFVVLMKKIKPAVVLTKAEKIRKAIEEIYIQNKTEYKISVSIGIAYCNEHGTSYKKLYECSDAALYFSKEHGRNRFSVYNNQMKHGISAVKEIEKSGLIESKKFDENILEYVLRILYESSNKETAISAVLTMIGKHYDVSRVYVFEDSSDAEFTSNTFEWCNNGITPHIDSLQRLNYSDLESYKSNFNQEGIFYMEDIKKASPRVKKILKPQKVKSMLQFSILKYGEFVGFIGLDYCDNKRVPSQKELSDIKNISNILGVFIMEMRALYAAESTNTIIMSIVNGLESYAYVCDPQTHEILFINEKTSRLVPHSKIGAICYKAFWNKETQCDECPMKTLIGENKSQYSMDLYNYNLGIWVNATASWINWLNNKRVCLVNSVDITKYKS